MVNRNKLAICVSAIMVLTYFTVPSYSQDKPSLYVINMIVTRLIMQETGAINTRQISHLKIIKELQSNGRYCIEVTYNRISDEGKTYPESGKFFIEKKSGIWIGGKRQEYSMISDFSPIIPQMFFPYDRWPQDHQKHQNDHNEENQ
jgi:hypothetical protein